MRFHLFRSPHHGCPAESPEPPGSNGRREQSYVEIVDELAGTDDAFPQDEWEDVTNYSAEAGGWVLVPTPEEADFIFHVDVKKKVVFFSPRTWLTPSVRLKDGTVLWQGKTYKADADIDNGFRATNAAIAKMLKNGFGKDLFPKIGRN